MKTDIDVPLRALAEAAYQHTLRDGGCAGLCLPVTAALGWALREHYATASVAVAGSLHGQPHWWLDVEGMRIDVTRHQFEDVHDLLYPQSPDDGYVPEQTHPALWTREQVLAEARRSFAMPAEAHVWAMPLLGDLEALRRSR